jgi:hypothetical protein
MMIPYWAFLNSDDVFALFALSLVVQVLKVLVQVLKVLVQVLKVSVQVLKVLVQVLKVSVQVLKVAGSRVLDLVGLFVAGL